jgi:hypothetical protein
MSRAAAAQADFVLEGEGFRMALVDVIHAADDALPARALAEKLRQAGVEVRLADAAGDGRQSTVAIALWSPRSNTNEALIEAADAARDRLVHVTMQQAPLPQAFAGDAFVNLTGWRGEDDFPAWRELAKLVTNKAGLPPLPPPTPRPSPFFQPARISENTAAPATPPRSVEPPPRPQRPTASAERRPTGMETVETERGGLNVMVIAAAVLALVLVGGGAYWFLGRGGGAQTVSLEDVDIGDPSALRAFIETTTSGSERSEAREALATLEQQSLDAARDANTIEAFEQFLRDFPNSEEAIFVQGQIQELRLQDVPQAATTEAVTAPTDVDPDLIPPGTTPDANVGDGPAQLTPPAPEPSPAPSEETAPPPT